MPKNTASSIKSKAAAVNDKLPWLKYFIFFYAFICLYNLLVVNHGRLWTVGPAAFTYHLVDFSFGFYSKLLVGALYRFIFKETAQETVDIYETVLLLIAFAGVCFLISKFLCSITEKKIRFAAFVLCLFFTSGPSSFGIFAERLGILDSYWFFIAVIFMFTLDTKYLKFTAPLLVFLLLLVHFGSIVNYVILFCMILLYTAAITEDKKAKKVYFILFALSAVTGIAGFLYFSLNEGAHMAMSMEEFDNELIARAGAGNKDKVNAIFYDYAFFTDEVLARGGEYYNVNATIESIPGVGDSVPDFIAGPVNMILMQLYLNFRIQDEIIPKLFYTPYIFLCCLPLLAFICSVWIKLLRSEKNKLVKFCYFLAVVQYPFSAVFGVLSSTDVTRFLGHAFLVQLTFLLYALYKNAKVQKAFTDRFSRVDLRAVAAYYFVYMLTAVKTYV